MTGAEKLAEAMRQLAESSRRAAEAMRKAEIPLILEGLDLVEWDAEMDNCYPGFD